VATESEVAVKSLPKRLKTMAGVSLADLESLSLRDRVESKAIAPVSVLPELVDALADDFDVLEHQGLRSQLYSNLYFDTEGLDCYVEHHNNKQPRYKLRYRSYVRSRVAFLEVKEKLNTGRTTKHRMQTDDSGLLTADESNLVFTTTGRNAESLQPVLLVDYTRITFASKAGDERVTLDLDLTFSGPANRTTFDSLLIFEVKQAELMRNSPAMTALRLCGLRPSSMSKYCVGVATCMETVKANRFKPLLGRLHGLQASDVDFKGPS
jgi:hypothetical protein